MLRLRREERLKRRKKRGIRSGLQFLRRFVAAVVVNSLLHSLTCIMSLFARRHRFWRSLCFWFFVRSDKRGGSDGPCSSPRGREDDALMPEKADAPPIRLASVALAPAVATSAPAVATSAPAVATSAPAVATSAPAAVSRLPIATTSGPSLSPSISKKMEGRARRGQGTRIRKPKKRRKKN